MEVFMKRLLLATALLSIIALTAGCSQQSTPVSTDASNPTAAATAAATEAATEVATEAIAPAASEAVVQQNSGTVDLEQAKAAALADAGLDASQVQFTKQSLETDDGVQKYEIEFTANGYEYEYDIDPKSGNIIEKSKEIID